MRITIWITQMSINDDGSIKHSDDDDDDDDYEQVLLIKNM
jgi:hypothetical protein